MALALKSIVRRQVFSPPFALSPAAISKSSRCPQLQELRLARAWEGSPKFLRRANYNLLGEGSHFWTGKLASTTLKLEWYVSDNFVTWLFVSEQTLATFQSGTSYKNEF